MLLMGSVECGFVRRRLLHASVSRRDMICVHDARPETMGRLVCCDGVLCHEF